MRWLKALLLLLCCQATSAPAEVMVEEMFTHYWISPTSVSDIRTELHINSPVSRNNRVFHGNTQWHIVPNFRWKQDPYSCRITDVSVRLNTTYTLPKLANRSEVSEATIAEFERYYNALLEHEKGHHAFGREAANKINELLVNFDTFADCKSLTAEAKKQIQGIITHYSLANKEYDQVTGHGRTQGAVIR